LTPLIIFADEIFRVYAKNHPDIALHPVKMEENVEKMVNRAMPSMGEKTNNKQG